MVNLSIVMLVLVFFALVIVVGIIIASRARHTSTLPNITGEERGGDMLKTAYIYIVLLATLMMTIGGSVAAFMAVADIVAPPAYHQTFEDYSRMPEKFSGQPATNLSQEELKKNYDAMVKQQQQQVKDRAVNSLIKSFGWIVIPLPVFMYYQRKLKDKPQA
ncbi:MAG: hypothetical protein QMC95_03160 [Desulfitobacteriaceae bacterium]|nr:hypothetical protein [Desulfitobacteriaceae bacterium]